METVKNIIIGFGKGGKTLAKFLAQHGEQVLVIEKSKQMYGGTCINIACLPSKRLIIEAAHGTSFEDAVDGKNVMTSQLRQKNYQMLASEDNITVLDGTAHFTGNHTIDVQTPDGQTLSYKGERIFINTGATPTIPDIPGLKDNRFLMNSTQAMDQPKLPRELVIIGGGYIGLEFANMFTSFGSHVTVLDHHQTLLPREDDDVAEMVIQNFKDNGVRFEVGVDIKAIGEQDNQAAITFARTDNRETTIFADKILVATGRKPATAAQESWPLICKIQILRSLKTGRLLSMTSSTLVFLMCGQSGMLKVVPNLLTFHLMISGLLKRNYSVTRNGELVIV